MVGAKVLKIMPRRSIDMTSCGRQHSTCRDSNLLLNEFIAANLPLVVDLTLLRDSAKFGGRMDDKLFCKLPSKLVDFELAIAICEVEMSLVISTILPNVGRLF